MLHRRGKKLVLAEVDGKSGMRKLTIKPCLFLRTKENVFRTLYFHLLEATCQPNIFCELLLGHHDGVGFIILS
jgi:hypothetical protein